MDLPRSLNYIWRTERATWLPKAAFFSCFNGHAGKFAKSDKTDPETSKKVIFWPFLAFEGRFGGLKDSLEVRVEHETCRTIHGTHLEGISSQKNWTGLAGGVRNGHFWPKYGFWGLPGPLNHVFFKTGASGFPVLPRHVGDRQRCSADSRRKKLRFEGCWSNVGLTVHEIETISRGDLFNSNLGEIVT